LLPVGQEHRHHGCHHPRRHSLLPPPPLLPSLLPTAISIDAIAAIAAIAAMDNFCGTDMVLIPR
jgi:hypothetical protein